MVPVVFDDVSIHQYGQIIIYKGSLFQGLGPCRDLFTFVVPMYISESFFQCLAGFTLRMSNQSPCKQQRVNLPVCEE